jgi:alkylation response protein AidB-like acyl-CoA dehydrogenase
MTRTEIELEDLDLDDGDRAVRELTRSIVTDVVRPRARELDESGKFPFEGMRAFADAGLFGVLVPAEYGGARGTMLQYALIVEEIARGCAGTCSSYITQNHAMLPIIAVGDEAQKHRFLPDMMSAARLGSIAITEPDAGSDIGAMRTRAVRVGDDYVLSGEKMFITNGGVADVFVVFARTADGDRRDALSAFVVEAGPGVVPGRSLDKCGIRASNTVPVSLQDVRIPAANRLGPEGVGFHLAVTVLSDARLSTAAQAVGIAQEAFDIAFRYTRERHQFGHPVYDFQAVQLRLVNMKMALATARLLVYQAARLIDAGARSDYSVEASLAKVYCSDVAMRVASDAVELLGGYGYIRDYDVERCFRDAKITQIYDGTNDVNRLVAGRQLGKRASRAAS